MSEKIYVDALMDHGWRLGPSCHLFVKRETPLEVLHRFAARLGLKRQWFQLKDKPGALPHYDLTVRRRAAAVRAGAVELERDEAVAIWRAYRG